ncbi:MAG: hypothetical protein ACRDTC_28470 [Pseudonocardiaceae bacterium]
MAVSMGMSMSPEVFGAARARAVPQESNRHIRDAMVAPTVLWQPLRALR